MGPPVPYFPAAPSPLGAPTPSLFPKIIEYPQSRQNQFQSWKFRFRHCVSFINKHIPIRAPFLPSLAIFLWILPRFAEGVRERTKVAADSCGASAQLEAHRIRCDDSQHPRGTAGVSTRDREQLHCEQAQVRLGSVYSSPQFNCGGINLELQGDHG